MILFMSCLLLASCGQDFDTNMSEAMEDFSFTTQNKVTLGLEDLKGEWWIANFFYTNCRTICPRTTANLKDVQSKLNESGYRPQIVSFSIDPAFDTPKKLKGYAKEYEADLNTWHFLTGYDFDTIKRISEHTFKAVLEKGAVNQRSHSYAFYLIDPTGTVVKQYNGMSKNDLETLIRDIQIVSS